MNNEDKEIEKYLSEFRPRAVRNLQVAAKSRGKWMAAAAAVAMCVGSGVWYARHAQKIEVPTPVDSSNRQPSAMFQRPNLFYLTKLALGDDARFQAQLAAESRTVLPSFKDPQSTFHVLAKE